MLKKILFRFLIFSGLVTVLIVVTVATLLNWPAIFLGDRIVKIALNYAELAGYRVRYDSAVFSTESVGFADERIMVDFKNICVDESEGRYSACFDSLSAAFRYSFSWYVPKIEELGPVKAVVREFVYNGPYGKIIAGGTFEAILDKEDRRKIDYSGNAIITSGEISGNTDFEGYAKKDDIYASFKMSAKNQGPVVDKMDISDCEISMKEKDHLNNDGQLGLNCSLRVYMKRFDLPDTMEKVYQSPDIIDIDLKSDLETFFIPDPEHKTKGTVELALRSFDSKVIGTSGSVKMTLDGVMTDFPKRLNVATFMDIDFKIPRFENIVHEMEDTPLSIYAPLNALKGPITFSIEGNIPSLTSLAYFPVIFESRLEAENEKFYIDAKGEARFYLRGDILDGADLDLDIILTDILIPLPNLEMTSLPSLRPDPRIKIGDERPNVVSEKGGLKYNISISTPENSPARILSNIAKNAIPIHLNINTKDDIYSGTIKIDSFGIVLFNKEALIKNLELLIKDPFGGSDIKSQIEFKASEYTITINIAGTVDQTNIWFTSDPPLSEEDIVGVLLYGEPFDDLDTEKAESVGNMRAAMSNKAIAVGTFLLMGTSPLQSVTYNPDTRTMTAKIRLGQKTSLSIGKPTETTEQIGLRRRLGSGWQINTYMSKDSVNATTSGSAYLEWHKKY